MLELYNAPKSTCSQKVRIVLAEKALEWQDRPVDLARQEHLSDWYLKLNPNGVVPTLVHDGRAVIDSSVIGEYIEEVFPEKPLAPDDPWGRAKMRAWRQYIDEVPTAAVRPPSFNAFVQRNWAGMNERQFEEFTAKMPLRKHFYRRMGQQGFSEADIRDALEKLRSCFERVERELASEPWLAGGRFTLADIALTPSVVRMEDLGHAQLWSDLPRFADWYARIRARPSFALAYYPGSRALDPVRR